MPKRKRKANILKGEGGAGRSMAEAGRLAQNSAAFNGGTGTRKSRVNAAKNKIRELTASGVRINPKTAGAVTRAGMSAFTAKKKKK